MQFILDLYFIKKEIILYLEKNYTLFRNLAPLNRTLSQGFKGQFFWCFHTGLPNQVYETSHASLSQYGDIVPTCCCAFYYRVATGQGKVREIQG